MDRLVFDHLVSQKMAPWWFAIFVIWLGGSVLLLWDNGWSDKASWQLIGVIAPIGLLSGLLAFNLTKDWVTGKIDRVTLRRLEREGKLKNFG